MTIKVTYNVTDVYMTQSVSPVYINVSYSDGSGGAAVWGGITGTLSNQTDLQTALDGKLDESTIDGGSEGQILVKNSATDFDFAWINNYAKYLATNVRNQTGSTIAAFQVVYISGATGNKPLISLADADTEATSSKTYGVTATSIANNGTGDVVTAGELSGINTSAFTEGDSLWLSTTAGGVVTTPPAEPAHAVFIGTVIRSHPTFGVIDVAIQNGYELTELHGVLITSPANNQGLFYNSGNGLWENKSIATVLGYTPEQPLTFNSPLSRAGNVVSIPQATGSLNGFLSATDWTTFNSKQAALGYTPANAATTLTINGVTYDLSQNRTWTISAGISGSGTANELAYFTASTTLASLSVATYPSLTEISYVKGVTSALQTQLNAKQGTLTLTTTGTSGAATLIGNTLNIPQYSGGGGISGTIASGQVAYGTAANTIGGSNNLFWDNTNGRLGIGTNAPATTLTVNASLLIGTTLLNANTAAFPLQINLNNTGSNVGAIWRNQSSTGYTSFRFYNDQNLGTRALEFGYSGSAYSGAVLTGGVSGESAYVVSTGAYALQFGTNNAFRGMFSSGGNLLLGTTTDDGVNRLQVSGSVAFGGSTGLKWDNTNLRIGVRNGTPGAAIDVWNNSTTENAQYRISDSRVSIPSYSATGFSPALGSNTLGFFAPASSSTGGVQFSGFTSGNNSAFPLYFIGYHGGTSPTNPALTFLAFKHDGANNRTALTGSEIIAGFRTGSNADVFQVKANGRINMSSLPTSSAGLSAGDIWNDAGTLKIV